MKSSSFRFSLLLATIFIVVPSFSASTTEFRIAIDTIRGYLYSFTEIAIRNQTDANDSSLVNGKSVGRFSLLISYETECLTFVEARKGSMLVEQDWESFNYQAEVNGTQGLIRITAIADTNENDSFPHLPRANQGEWVVLKFRTTNDRTLMGQCCPVNWYWLDCQDNVLSDSTGNASWVVDTLFTSSGSLVDLSSFFPTDVSRCDTILGPASKRFVVFSDGHVCLLGCGCIDDRGDLNLNGVAYEIADYILYQEYFVYGDSVFSTDPQRRQGQIAASEVNGDDLTLHVSDLVFLARIITGDANPLPKSVSGSLVDSADFQIVRAVDRLTVWVNSAIDISGVFLRFNISGTPGTPEKLYRAQNLDLGYMVSSNELRLLLSPPLTPYDSSKIPVGNWPILSIPFVGDLQEIEIQASNHSGQELAATASLIQTRGDLNADRSLSPADVVLELTCVFLLSNCSLGLADLNCDSALSPTDVMEILNAVFLAAPLSCL